jgi:hypothetical protein
MSYTIRHQEDEFYELSIDGYSVVVSVELLGEFEERGNGFQDWRVVFDPFADTPGASEDIRTGWDYVDFLKNDGTPLLSTAKTLIASAVMKALQGINDDQRGRDW